MLKYVQLKRFYSSSIQEEIFPRSTVKRYSKVKTRESKKVNHVQRDNVIPETKEVPNDDEFRCNSMGIQMLSRNLYNQVFGSNEPESSSGLSIKELDWRDELARFGINADESPKLPDVKLKLPKLEGENIVEHFNKISEKQAEPYRQLIEKIIALPTAQIPKEFVFQEGWTHYTENGPVKIDYPSEPVMVFDVEVCVTNSQLPVMACAFGINGWYSWTSRKLIDTSIKLASDEMENYSANDFVPLGSNKGKPKLVVGHNVSYDRARIKEQYDLHDTGTSFLDTMSMHVCVSGVTSYQRALLKSKKTIASDDVMWREQTSLNSLQEVYKLYCSGTLEKDSRELFVKGNLNDIRDNFQSLARYCATDVVATHKVLCELYPLFNDRFKHPATLAGMLEIGNAYLPINHNWNRYIKESQLTYEDLEIDAKNLLARKADTACRLMHNDAYTKNLWLWDQDWSIQEFKPKKTATVCSNTKLEELKKLKVSDKVDKRTNELKEMFKYLWNTTEHLPKRRPLLPGYPAWYRKLCDKPTEENWNPGPINLGIGMQITSKLLELCWNGYPLHYIKEYGWGFLVPYKSPEEIENEISIPLSELVARCPIEKSSPDYENIDDLGVVFNEVNMKISKRDYYDRKRSKSKPKDGDELKFSGVWCNVALDNCCWFMKLPHKDGASNNVGNPLARDFLNKFADNVLTGNGKEAQQIIEIARKLSYWRNNRDRITGQVVGWLNSSNEDLDEKIGAIIPQVVVSGTLTRRAVEPTWMTATNAQSERIGSELRSMVQAPPGYKIVGADVDSQELWIASILGDAYATGLHGATAFGWMTLSGTKSAGTDMHSVTAKAVGISRDHAKVINYARIYGAGQNFAERLLKQFNPTLSDAEARSKAMKMFVMTKGKRLLYLLPEYKETFVDKGYTQYEAMKLAAINRSPMSEMFTKPIWIGGSESAMFNRLEEIAEGDEPVTPFLECRLSRALEKQPGIEDRFLPTRVNWVVQSGAVDFLHLMLVSMRWLMGPKIKFCLSFHDEVRYLVPEAHAYEAAVALHITNLLTRSFCAYKVGLKDLPQSVAFFTAVEVDSVLRKESHMDCKTPSNPHGLEIGYGIPPGESLNITDAMQKLENKRMSTESVTIKY